VRAAVLAGGRSSEHEVSLASAAAVRAGLAQRGHDVADVEIDREGVWRHEGVELLLGPGRGLLDAEVVFPILHGPFGEDGTVQGLLECLDVPYVGAGVLASAVCMDKLVFKDLMGAAGLPQVDYRAVPADDFRSHPDALHEPLSQLGLPVFVKPARLGSSVGIVKVSREQELHGALEQALSHDPRAIVEASAPGIEVECSVIGHTGAPETSQPGEIVLEREWYDYEAKYTPGGMQLVVPARISATALERVRHLAADAFTLAGVSGLARVDFFVDGEDVLVNELNTMPGFTETSVFGRLFEASGVPYGELLDRLAQVARERHAMERSHRH